MMVNGCFFLTFFWGRYFFGTAQDLAIKGSQIWTKERSQGPPRIYDDKVKTLGFLLMFTVNNFKPMEFLWQKPGEKLPDHHDHPRKRIEIQ